MAMLTRYEGMHGVLHSSDTVSTLAPYLTCSFLHLTAN